MNIVLWIIQILLALLFLFSGLTKLLPIITMPPPPPGMWMPPMWFLKFIGLCEFLGALGLVLPGLFPPSTIPDSVGRDRTHDHHDWGLLLYQSMAMGVAGAVTPLIVGLLCVFVAYGRRGWMKA
jgi:hypothetical protein